MNAPRPAQQVELAEAADVFDGKTLSLEPPVAHPIAKLEPVAPPAPAGQVMNPHRLVEMAVERGMPIETIEKLLTLAERFDVMQEAQRKRLAESAFIRALMGLKSEVVTVAKTKRVHYETKDRDGRKSGAVDFKHAELSDIMEAIAEPAARYGLTWNYPQMEQGDGWVRVTCRLRHVDGHFEDLTLGAPEDTSGKKNAAQAICSAITYMERYTLKGLLGISEKGDDNHDSRRPDDQGGRDDSPRDGGQSQTAASALEQLRDAGRAAAMNGMAPLTAWWAKLSAREQKDLSADFTGMRKAARAADGSDK